MALPQGRDGAARLPGSRCASGIPVPVPVPVPENRIGNGNGRGNGNGGENLPPPLIVQRRLELRVAVLAPRDPLPVPLHLEVLPVLRVVPSHLEEHTAELLRLLLGEGGQRVDRVVVVGRRG